MDAYEFVPQLESFIKRQMEIAGSWNGEDAKYNLQGEVFTEDDAQIAKERLEAAEGLLKVITEYDL